MDNMYLTATQNDRMWDAINVIESYDGEPYRFYDDDKLTELADKLEGELDYWFDNYEEEPESEANENEHEDIHGIVVPLFKELYKQAYGKEFEYAYRFDCMYKGGDAR